MKTPSFVCRFLVCVFFLCCISPVQAECNIHDHQCQFHSIGNQFAHVGNNVHHTKGVQLNPNIPDNLEEGLFAVGVWQDNASGQSADLDVDVLLPSFTQDLDGAIRPAGAFIVTDNAAQGGAESSSDPFIGYAQEHDRHVSTFQHQVTFNNAFATAQHSKDANGLAPIPASTADKACTDTNNFGADSCEAVHIKGDVPTGVYSVAVTNFDVHNLSDPSTPHYDMWVYATPTTQGTLVSTGPEEHLSGSLANKGETSGVHSVFFRRWEQKPHAEMGVVYDIYAGTLPGKTSYSNPYKKRYGDMIYTFQDKTVQYVTTQYSDTITGDGINRGTKNLGVIGKKNITNTNTVAVHKVVRRPLPKPKPQITQPQTQQQAKLGSCNPTRQSCPAGTEMPAFMVALENNKNGKLPYTEQQIIEMQREVDANSTRAMLINNSDSTEKIAKLVLDGRSYKDAKTIVSDEIDRDIEFANYAYNKGAISDGLVPEVKNKFRSDNDFVSDLRLYENFSGEYVPPFELNKKESTIYIAAGELGAGDIHYSRNLENDIFLVDKELYKKDNITIDELNKKGFALVKEDNYHTKISEDDNENNQKWTFADGSSYGSYEIIIEPNGDFFKHETDDNVMGTLNYGGNPVSHTIYDVVPYFIYGNSPKDETTINEMINASFDN